MITPPVRAARSRASADLPLAVGPAIRTARLRTLFASSLKARADMPVLCLTANPADPELDTALVARVVQQTGGELNWLNHGVACEILEPRPSKPLK